jgi:hypothetical protein
LFRGEEVAFNVWSFLCIVLKLERRDNFLGRNLFIIKDKVACKIMVNSAKVSELRNVGEYLQN